MGLTKVHMRYLIVVWYILTICASSSDGLNKTDEIVKTSLVKNDVFPDLKAISFTNEDEDIDGGCREVSLHKCGSSLVQVFRLLDFLPLRKALDSKCSLRKAFFTCLKTDEDPCKKRRWSIYHSTAFRKKLLRSLWSTRRCVLGYRPEDNEV